MEKLRTLKTITLAAIVTAALLGPIQGFSQPDYAFANPTRLSGTHLKEGAIYRFSNVRPGIDARMTITFISDGIEVTELDGSSGYPATLQPTITAEPWTSGYVEMQITFYEGGTLTPMAQPQLAVTPFDVDGVTNHDGHGRNLYEFDQINLGGGYVDFNTIGGELSISETPDHWVTGTNISATDYPGRDTSAQQVMFSVINNNVTTMTLRVGVNNETSSSASRQRAVYFKKFVFNNSILAVGQYERLRPKKETSKDESFRIYPTVINHNATIELNADGDGWASFELFDLSGRKVVEQRLVINKGENKIPFFGASKMTPGNYVALVKMNGLAYSYKLIKQ
jgi:hypothetical protein